MEEWSEVCFWAMKSKAVLGAALSVLILTGCGVTDLAKSAAQGAADATACKALESTIKSLTGAYQSGLVDSGLITQIDNLVGDQARALLSTGLTQDINALTDALGETQTAAGSKEKLQEITDSITKRCTESGVTIS